MQLKPRANKQVVLGEPVGFFNHRIFLITCVVLACIAVIALPVAAAGSASFSPSVSSGTAPLTVTFTDTSTNSPISWSWTFGDGSTSTAQNPTHIYTTAGSYPVTLTVMPNAANTATSTTATETITVSAATTAITAIGSISGTDQVGNTLTAGTLTPSGATVTYQWEESTSATGTYTAISGATSSTYTPVTTDYNQYIEVVATGTGSYTGTVTSGDVGPVIAAIPVIDEISLSSGSIDGGTVVTITGSGFTSATSVKFGSTAATTFSVSTDNSISATSPAESAGTVDITVTNPSGTSATSIQDEFTFTAITTATTTTSVTAPVASFYASPLNGSAPLTVQFEDQSTNSPTGWYWTFGDGNFSSAQSPSFTYDIPGTYSVTLVVNNTGGSNTDTQNDYITVNASAITPVASFSASPTMGSAPLTVQFTDLSTNSPTSWSWNFGDGTGTSTVENPSYTYSTAGTYTVTMTATNTAGSNQATSQTIIVSPASETPQVTLVTIATPTPVPTFPSLTFSGTPTSGAAPLTVQFTTSTSGTPTSWSWDFGDGGSSKVQNPSYTYVIPGIYTVTLTANYPEGSQPVVMSSYITVTSGSTHSPLSPFIAVGAIGTMGMISVVMSRRKRQ